MKAKVASTEHEKKSASRKRQSSPVKHGINSSLKTQIIQPFARIKSRASDFLARRPHRSFRKSDKRDYARSLELPGYWEFTRIVSRMLWEYRRLFIWIVVIYAVLSGLFVGLASQETYSTLSDTLKTTSDNVLEGSWGEVGKASSLFVSSITGSISATPTEAQQVYAGFIGLLIWLTTVWLLRAVMAGQKPRFRDGLYNAGAPIVPTIIVSLILLIQLIPAALAVIAFGAASSTGFLQGGVEAMLFTVVALLLIILSVYWVTSTIIALTVVTLPGMYPMQALKTAGDLVIGRRLRVLLRWVWLALLLFVGWPLVLIPIIIFDAWIKGVLPVIQWMPIIPVSLLILSSLTVVLAAVYVYVLYRKVVEDDAAPA